MRSERLCGTCTPIKEFNFYLLKMESHHKILTSGEICSGKCFRRLALHAMLRKDFRAVRIQAGRSARRNCRNANHLSIFMYSRKAAIVSSTAGSQIILAKY